jgi:hypothetical protein
MTDKRNPGDLQATVDKLGLLVTSQFVPFSQSRNAAEKLPSLNWRVTLSTLSPLDGQRRVILTTDYMAGSGHAPSYKQTFGKRTVEDQDREARVTWECENGRPAHKFVNVRVRATGPATIEPNALDVIHSLVMDSDVLDSGGFESWASDLGFDVDSRKAEAIYRACLDIALKLRSAIGDAGLSALRTAFQDY